MYTDTAGRWTFMYAAGEARRDVNVPPLFASWGLSVSRPVPLHAGTTCIISPWLTGSRHYSRFVGRAASPQKSILVFARS